jgi:hypothetical protein
MQSNFPYVSTNLAPDNGRGACGVKKSLYFGLSPIIDLRRQVMTRTMRHRESKNSMERLELDMSVTAVWTVGRVSWKDFSLRRSLLSLIASYFCRRRVDQEINIQHNMSTLRLLQVLCSKYSGTSILMCRKMPYSLTIVRRTILIAERVAADDDGSRDTLEK